MSVLKKLNEARMKFHASNIKKSGHNKFAGYSYFELSDFLVPAIKICNDLNLSVVVSFESDKATMTLTDLDDGSQHFITSPMSEANLKGCHPIQNLGAVQTYIRRYLWVCALEIVEHDAIDSSEPVKPQTKATPTAGAWESMDEESQKYLQELADQILMLDTESQVKLLETTQLESEEKVALWTRLDSKTRAAIKKYQQENKQ